MNSPKDELDVAFVGQRISTASNAPAGDETRLTIS